MAANSTSHSNPCSNAKEKSILSHALMLHAQRDGVLSLDRVRARFALNGRNLFMDAL